MAFFMRRWLFALGIAFLLCGVTSPALAGENTNSLSALKSGASVELWILPSQKVSLRATLSEYHKARLSWNPVAGADGYDVFVSTGRYGAYGKIADVTATVYTDGTLNNAKTYYYKVRPYTMQNGVQSSGAFSNIRSVKPRWPSVALRVTLKGMHSAQLAWTKLAYADGYELQRSIRKSGPYTVLADVSDNTFLDGGLAADTTYYYRIRAYDTVNGTKYYGNFSTIKTMKAKWPAPSLNALAFGYNSVRLVWKAMADVDGYEVLRSAKPTGDYMSLGFVSDNAFSDTGLAPDTYYYKVRPYVQTGGEKAFGKCCVYRSSHPQWPSITLRAQRSGSEAILGWNAIDGVSGYEVERAETFDGPYQPIGVANTNALTDIGFTEGAKFYYRVRPIANENGTNAYGPYCVPVYLRAYDTEKPLAGLVIGIDAGHQAHADYAKEPEAPGSSVLKAKVSSGTRGIVSRVYEYEVNLSVAKKLKSILESLGAEVVLTRETNDIHISNSQRAKFFNANKTDYAIRLHCNGSTNTSVYGAYVLIPTKNPYQADCQRAATLLTQAVANETGAKTYPYVPRSDQAGFNYCERMIINIEMGYMTNAAEDRHLVDASYQQRMAQGLANGILAYFGVQ